MQSENRPYLTYPDMVAATQLHSSLLTISVGALLLPAVYHFSLGGSSEEVLAAEKQRILNMSYGVSQFNLLYFLNR
jgi:Ca2+:H+ antiporter